MIPIYIAKKRLKVGDGFRENGDPIPEASGWRKHLVQRYLSLGWIEAVRDEEVPSVAVSPAVEEVVSFVTEPEVEVEVEVEVEAEAEAEVDLASAVADAEAEGLAFVSEAEVEVEAEAEAEVSVFAEDDTF